MAQADHGGSKLWLVRQLLADRRQRPDAYDGAPYVPVAGRGPKARHLVAFERRDTLVVVPRLVVGLGDDWQDTTIDVPDGEWRDVVTGTAVTGGTAVPVATLLARFPVTVLARPR
jgi:(1->4)-alpha-D-glucan 1-alpha-D-glucosylmutase